MLIVFSTYQQTLTKYNRWICAVDISRFVPKSNQIDRQTEMCVCRARLNTVVQLVKCGMDEQYLSDMREKIK